MNTIVYIDGYNLYYGALKPNPSCKWLDLHSLCVAMLPTHNVTGIKYFTAKIKAYPNDPSAPQRQQAYLRAIATIATVEIIEGWYIIGKKNMVLASDYANLKPGDIPTKVRVVKSEEKGSDVNLASHLILDGVNKCYEMPTVLSCDSDLKEPLRLVKEKLGFKIALATPQLNHNNKLSVLADEKYFVSNVDLTKHQLPDRLTAKDGKVVHRPKEWV